MIPATPVSAGLYGETHSENALSGAVATPNMHLAANLPTGPGGDLGFWRTTAVASLGVEDGVPANDGFALIDIRDPYKPREISRFLCPGSAESWGGHDVSIWSNLVVMSSQAWIDGASCQDGTGTGSGGETIPPGITIVDVSDPEHPTRLASLGTGCEPEEGKFTGAHTHTLIPDLDRQRVVVYSASLGCLSVVEIPLRDPANPRLIRNMDDIKVGQVDGVAPEGANGACHDIQVYLPGNLAACAADGDRATQLWDISDLERPVALSTIRNRVLEHHHSAAFSSDGKVLVIGEENASNLAANSCSSGTKSAVGAVWFYDITNPRSPVLKSHFQNPARGPEPTGYCSAHYFNVVPLRDGRDVLVAAWYRSGTVVVDFTNPSEPTAIGYYIADAGDPDRASFAYASYWYNGFVYVNNIAFDPLSYEGLPADGRIPRRGFDVLTIDDPALKSAVHLQYLNPGTQTWGNNSAAPDRAYLR